MVSLINWCFNRESKTCICTSYNARVLSIKNYDSYNVGFALTYVQLLLPSRKTYMCNLMAWYIIKKWGFKWTLTVLHFKQIYFYIVMRVTVCLTFTNIKVMTSRTCLSIPLDIFTIYSPSKTLNIRNIFLIYIKQNFNCIKQILQTKKILPWIWIYKFSELSR